MSCLFCKNSVRSVGYFFLNALYIHFRDARNSAGVNETTQALIIDICVFCRLNAVVNQSENLSVAQVWCQRPRASEQSYILFGTGERGRAHALQEFGVFKGLFNITGVVNFSFWKVIKLM